MSVFIHFFICTVILGVLLFPYCIFLKVLLLVASLQLLIRFITCTCEAIQGSEIIVNQFLSNTSSQIVLDLFSFACIARGHIISNISLYVLPSMHGLGWRGMEWRACN